MTWISYSNKQVSSNLICCSKQKYLIRVIIKTKQETIIWCLTTMILFQNIDWFHPEQQSKFLPNYKLISPRTAAQIFSKIRTYFTLNSSLTSSKTWTDFTPNSSLNLFQNMDWFHPKKQLESLPKHKPISPRIVAWIFSKIQTDFTPNSNPNLFQNTDWFHTEQQPSLFQNTDWFHPK